MISKAVILVTKINRSESNGSYIRNMLWISIHRDNIVACLMKGNLDNKPTSEIRTFPALQHGLKALKEWIEKEDCHNIAMESTGIYWKPVYTVLEEAFLGDIEIMLVNAQKIKNVPGRKTDVKDSLKNLVKQSKY